MTKTFLDGRVNLLCGDSREMMKTLPDASVDSIVTDPPYGLGFMGKKWDTPGALVERKAATENKWDHVGGNHNPSNSADAARTARVEGHKFGTWCEEWAREAFRVLKPGGHLLAFSGTRTYHRLACAIEDAGFEVRDQIGWAYGGGMPKGLNVGKALEARIGDLRRDLDGFADKSGCEFDELSEKLWQLEGELDRVRGWNTSLKPAWEPICLARKPLIDTVLANMLAHGVGGLNCDACRIEADARPLRELDAKPTNSNVYAGRTGEGGLGKGFDGGSKAVGTTDVGRWPANIILDGSHEVVECFPDAPGQIADASASAPSMRTQNCYGAMKRGNGRDGEASGDRRYTDKGCTSFAALPGQRRGDIGSAARFFYQVKMEGGEWHGEARTRASSRDRASDVDGSISLQSEAVVSALKRAVDTSAVGLTLNSASYRAPSTTVTASECEQIAMLVTEMTQNIARRCSLGQPPENITQSDNLASIVATRKPTGTIAITISPSKSNGSADPVTFDIIETKSELGASGSPKKRLHYTSKAGSDDRIASKHPTVKPVDLMQYLVRLVTPKNGLVLDPFAGTGTTGEAAWREGMRAVLIEREPEYQDDIARRMDLVLQPTKRAAVAKTKNKIDDHGPLFGGMEKTQ